MAEKKVYLGSQGPYLVDDAEDLDDGDGDFSGQKYAGLITNSNVVATEFQGIPISSVSVTNIDDPSTELNSLSASTVGGLISVYQAVGGADDEFTMYLWDTNAAAEDVPFTVDGSGGVWVAVGGKYNAGDVNVRGDLVVEGGAEIGNAAGDLIGFYGATAVNQPDAVADATGAGDVVAQLNALLARIRELGLIAT